jgi:hypothetical protein
MVVGIVHIILYVIKLKNYLLIKSLLSSLTHHSLEFIIKYLHTAWER